MKQGMKGKQKPLRGEDWGLWRALSEGMSERLDDVLQNNNVRAFSEWRWYWKCIFYKYFCKHCQTLSRLGPVTMTGPRSCSELSSRVKAWEASFFPASKGCQPEMKLLQSLELYGHEAGLLAWNLIPEPLYVSK